MRSVSSRNQYADECHVLVGGVLKFSLYRSISALSFALSTPGLRLGLKKTQTSQTVVLLQQNHYGCSQSSSSTGAALWRSGLAAAACSFSHIVEESTWSAVPEQGAERKETSIKSKIKVIKFPSQR